MSFPSDGEDDSESVQAVEEISNLADLISRSIPISYDSYPEKFVEQAYGMAVQAFKASGYLGESLAALFDLAVTALYLESVPNTGWVYCSSKPAVLVYPFVNACPRCSLHGRFHFVKSGKPTSANIGKATSRILSAFLDCQAKSSNGGYEVRALTGNRDAADAVLVGPEGICLFEIKASPLISFPLEAGTEELTALDRELGELVAVTDHSRLTVQYGVDAYLIINESLRIPVGSSVSFKSKDHYEHLLAWLRDGENLENYVAAWRETFAGYANDGARGATYWLTNGCGVPSPRPADWPVRRTGSGPETISDGKTSVGLDRTDDLKKGIYQVLKMSTHLKEFFPSQDHKVYVALVTNIHAVKHHDEYLTELEDLVWTLDGPVRSYVLRRDPEETVIATDHLYNLFDAIISFTRPYFRDDFLRGIYEFD